MFPLHKLAEEEKDSDEETSMMFEIVQRTGHNLMEDYDKNSLLNAIVDGGNRRELASIL